MLEGTDVLRLLGVGVAGRIVEGYLDVTRQNDSSRSMGEADDNRTVIRSAAMPKLDYPMYDADNHYYEPDDCFTRHIEAKYRDRTVWVDRSSDGRGRVYVGTERCHFFSVGGRRQRRTAGDHEGVPARRERCGRQPEPEPDQRAAGAGVRRPRRSSRARWTNRTSRRA